MAPYRPAAEVVRQKDRKNPIQLKRNATEKAGEKQQVKTPLYSKEKNKTPLHTGFSWCYMNINVTQTILGHCLEKKSSFHQVLTEESQHENAIISYPQLVSVIKVIPCHKIFVLQSKGIQVTQQPHSWVWLFKKKKKKGWNPKSQKARNASMKKFPVSHPEMVQGMKSYLYTRKCIFIFNRVKIQHVLVLTVKNSSTHQKIIISARNLASVKKCNEQWASDASRGGGNGWTRDNAEKTKRNNSDRMDLSSLYQLHWPPEKSTK